MQRVHIALFRNERSDPNEWMSSMTLKHMIFIVWLKVLLSFQSLVHRSLSSLVQP